MPRLVLAVMLCLAVVGLAQSGAKMPQPSGILQTNDLETLIPSAVYFGGQTATVQMRNSGGVRWAQSQQTLFAMVDVSGYSSALRNRYQFYILSDVPVEFAGRDLPAGAYGGAFIDNSGLLVMDLGGIEMFLVPYSADPAMKRPRPLQVLAGAAPGEYRLYLGRNYVPFRKK